MISKWERPTQTSRSRRFSDKLGLAGICRSIVNDNSENTSRLQISLSEEHQCFHVYDLGTRGNVKGPLITSSLNLDPTNYSNEFKKNPQWVFEGIILFENSKSQQCKNAAALFTAKKNQKKQFPRHPTNTKIDSDILQKRFS